MNQNLVSNGWLERDTKALAGVLPRCSDIVASHGEGSWLWDVDGNRYLDFASGIAANSTGHCHPRVVEAIKEQAETLIHTSVTTHNTLNIQLAEWIGELCPFFEEPQVFFTNSGAEAVDGSLKLARRATGRSGVVAFQGAFHGRTVAATSLTTAKLKYRSGYDLLPWVYSSAPYGENLDAVRCFLRGVSATGFYHTYKVGAVIVEPVLGEGGYIVPDREWLQGLRDLCDEFGALLIFDEVQTGIGRTGYPFAAETFGVRPDVLLFAKGIASGMPLGGIVAEKTLLDKWPEGTHGSTFGGNPVSCAAGLATLEVLEHFYDRVRYRGQHVIGRLSPFKAEGVGYMIGIPAPSKEAAYAVQQECLDNGMLILLCGPREDRIRLIPPLTATDADWAFGLDVLEGALAKWKK